MRAMLAGLIDDGLQRPVPRLRGRGAGDDGDRQRGELHVPEGVLKSARDVNAGLAALQAAVGNDERYSPAQFQAALQQLPRQRWDSRPRRAPAAS